MGGGVVLDLKKQIAVETIIQKDVLTCSADTPLLQVMRQMQSGQCTSIVIMEAEKFMGIWTDTDAFHLDFSDTRLFSAPIRDFMSSPVKTVHRFKSILDVSTRFKEEGLRHLVVVDDADRMVGIVTQSDVIRHQVPENFLYLGKVKTALGDSLLVLPGEMNLPDAILRFREAHVDAAVVTGFPENEFGIITERDIIRLLVDKVIHEPIASFANRPLLTIPAEETLLTAKDLLVQRHIRHLGVVNDEGEVIGILSFSDILRSIQCEYAHQLRIAVEYRAGALEKTQTNPQFVSSVLESMLEGIIVADSDAIIEVVNPAFTSITGYTADEVIGKTPNILHSDRHDDDFYTAMWKQINTKGHWQGEIWNKHKDGTVYPQWLAINTTFYEDGSIKGYVAIFSDISDQKKAEAQINSLADYDRLTQLPNRNLFMDRLSMALANAKRHAHRVAVILMDLDHFKRINDTLGHSVGDKVLKEVAERLSGCIREGETLGHLGGDEFVVVLPELNDTSEAIKVVQRTGKVLEEPFDLIKQKLRLTTSIGISFYPNDGVDAETLLKNADTAMYQAKNLGRNSFELYSGAMNKHSMKRLQLESDLHQALDNAELFLNYQVQMDLKTREIAGVEALLRWQGTGTGIIGPSDFIPLMEETGLIHLVGEWVLREACEQSMRWQEIGLPPTKMAVNLSSHQFDRSGIVDVVSNALDNAGLEPRFLELELTESCVMQKMDQSIIILNQFRELGVSVAIDDFGTGFSSLGNLRDLPIDVLKIDRSFLTDLDNNEKNRAIVSSIIELARNLKKRIIAEGVETNKQLEFLYKEGCDEIQGYLISRPVAADKIIDLYSRQLLPIVSGS